MILLGVALGIMNLVLLHELLAAKAARRRIKAEIEELKRR